jgi:hypothetical protein
MAAVFTLTTVTIAPRTEIVSVALAPPFVVSPMTGDAIDPFAGKY